MENAEKHDCYNQCWCGSWEPTKVMRCACAECWNSCVYCNFKSTCAEYHAQKEESL